MLISFVRESSYIFPEIRRSLRAYALIETPTSLAWLEFLLKKTVFNNWRYIDDSAAYAIRNRYSLQHSVPPELMYLSGLIFGAEDFASATGITRTSSLLEMIFARQKLVTLAKAYGLECFDLVCPRFISQKKRWRNCGNVTELIGNFRYQQTSATWTRYARNANKALPSVSPANKPFTPLKSPSFNPHLRLQRMPSTMRFAC